MKNLLLRTALSAAFCLAILVGPANGAPILDLSLDPNPIKGAAGASIDIYYTIYNSGDEVAELLGASVNVDPVLGIYTDLFDGLLEAIGPNDGKTGLLGTFVFAAGAPVGSHPGAFLVDIGFSWTDTAGEVYDFASADADVEVTTPVPEPATFSVTLLGLGLTIGFARRRR